MMKAKILVTGAFNAGKTTFIHSISEIRPVYTDKKMLDTEELTTVAMDFGRITIDDDLALYLFGTPGQERFDFMWEILKEDIIGFILLLDSVTPEIPTTQKILDFLISHSDVPFVIACTKRDHVHALPMETLREQMKMDDVPVIPCVATQRDSVKEVLLILLREILNRFS
ncbi:MAG: ATP/GTP-binding protein [Theionarchaea archaeon]|nr:ATP/GTP-binding protein [Theionarchaea archaeon]MBU7037103.1 ATP/GTP-binding protein [Theionarchaea archaeon]